MPRFIIFWRRWEAASRKSKIATLRGPGGFIKVVSRRLRALSFLIAVVFLALETGAPGCLRLSMSVWVSCSIFSNAPKNKYQKKYIYTFFGLFKL